MNNDPRYWLKKIKNKGWTLKKISIATRIPMSTLSKWSKTGRGANTARIEQLRLLLEGKKTFYCVEKVVGNRWIVSEVFSDVKKAFSTNKCRLTDDEHLVLVCEGAPFFKGEGVETLLLERLGKWVAGPNRSAV